MKILPELVLVLSGVLAMTVPAGAQDTANCFLNDFVPRYTAPPPYQDLAKITNAASIHITANAADTIGKVSKYIFGNAVAVWVGQNQNNPTLVSHLTKLAPTLIRFPGGSWSDIYFWNGNPGDLPSTIPDGQNNGAPIPLSPQLGPYYSLTPDQYYALRLQLGVDGLITVNYGYARYGQGEKPVERAAHLAADWVRYDNGRTTFWEIGNENAGPWEAGWQIDTTTNRDGQPKIITGELYGRHFRVFADSMRAAAAEIGATIYIGGQILHYDGTTSWNVGDHQWNEGFFREAGSSVDFYVMHNYFNSNNSSNAQTLMNFATDELQRNASFISSDIAAQQAAVRPVAVTEYNMGSSDATIDASFIKGMQEVILFCEMIKLHFGMSTRWLVANWESDGMFYNGGNSGIPQWTPRPEFYFGYYTQRFTGDHMVSAAVPGSQTVLAYATRFASGHLGIIIINKSKLSFTAGLKPGNYGFGDRFYVYSLKGGTDNGDFSQVVIVNDVGPVSPQFGPLAALDTLKANAYPTDDTELKFPLPARSAQFVLLEPGSHVINSVGGTVSGLVDRFALDQNFPNPFNPSTTIAYTLPHASSVTLQVRDILGREVATLLRNVRQQAGTHETTFNAMNLSSGTYFYTLRADGFSATKVMLLLK